MGARELETWLEWAGARLVAMPGPRVGPRDSGGYWPDYSQDVFEIIEFRARISLRVAAPGPSEIGLMEDILVLPNFIPDKPDSEYAYRLRKIARFRTLLHPITDRHLYPWGRLAEKFETSAFKVQKEYEKALIRICNNTPGASVKFYSITVL